MTCGACRRDLLATPNVAILLVYSPMLDRPYALDPADDYFLCDQPSCESVRNFVVKAIDAHPTTRSSSDHWTVCQISFVDPAWPVWRVERKRLRAQA